MTLYYTVHLIKVNLEKKNETLTERIFKIYIFMHYIPVVLTRRRITYSVKQFSTTSIF